MVTDREPAQRAHDNRTLPAERILQELGSQTVTGDQPGAPGVASYRRESGQLRGPFTGHAEWKSKRIIAVNVQGITRKKKDFTSLPLAKIQAFSVETAGTFDLDAELELWFSGLGKVKFEFSGKTDVAYLNKLVAHHVL